MNCAESTALFFVPLLRLITQVALGELPQFLTRAISLSLLGGESIFREPAFGLPDISSPGQGKADTHESPRREGSGCQTPVSQRRGWPEHYVWNPFAIKTLLERAGLGMGATSAGPCLSGA
jgi:hypothetical protein